MFETFVSAMSSRNFTMANIVRKSSYAISLAFKRPRTAEDVQKKISTHTTDYYHNSYGAEV